MARLAFGMNVSLDGYVDHDRFAPDPVLFRHWTEEVRRVSGSLYGRGMYEIMAYWDADRPEWGAAERDYAEAWRGMRKWVVSTTLTEVGPNAVLISRDIDAAIRRLKAEEDGEIAVLGTVLADHVSRMGLMDEYRLYLHPVVLGYGKPMFPNALQGLRLSDSERIGTQAIRLTYLPK